MVTPHPHAVTVLREKGVDVTSHNKRPDTVVVVVGSVWYGQRSDSGVDSRHAGCLLSWRKGVAVQETSQEQRGGARQGLVGAADRHSTFLT